MSGTSLDGVDLAHIDFEIERGKWKFHIYEAETIPYTNEWKYRLKEAINYSDSDLYLLNIEYTQLLSGIIKNFINRNNLNNVDAVCSHGHTVLHQPQNGITLQIGNLELISEFSKATVVCDFRVQDVQLGGQGAPLVPIGDRLLFPDYDYCLNLGGFSNISFEKNSTRLAFDISPVNTVLNFYAEKSGVAYDDKGLLAESGVICSDLLQELNNLEFYKATYPKSLGMEFVKTIILPVIEKYSIPIADKLKTFIEHIAMQTGIVITKKNTKMLVTGGGAYNDYLISRLKHYLKNVEIEIPEDKIIQYKEALIFGLLGVLKLRGEINVLSSVTGAVRDHSSGNVFLFK